MRGTGSGSRRRGVGPGHSVTHAVVADGEKRSTGIVQTVLHQLHLEVTHFHDAGECLDFLRNEACHLLISNARRPAEDGMKLLASAKRIAASVPVIVFVDHGDIQTAVRAMKSGAVECLERPPEETRLASAIDATLRGSSRRCVARKCPLSQAEKVVLGLILQGKTTAEVASIRNRSRRTIEVHRSHIMRKLRTESMVDLVRTAGQMGLLQDWP